MSSKKADFQKKIPLLATLTDADFNLPFNDFSSFTKYQVKLVFFDALQERVLARKEGDVYVLPSIQVQQEQVDEANLVTQCESFLGTTFQFFVPLGSIFEKRAQTSMQMVSYGYLFVLQGDGNTLQEVIEKESGKVFSWFSLGDVMKCMNSILPSDYEMKFEAKRDYEFLSSAYRYLQKNEKHLGSKKAKREEGEKVGKQGEQAKQEQSDEGNGITRLQNDIIRLQRELEEMKEIASKAQYDYVTLKMDFDMYKTRMEKQVAEGKVDVLIDVVRKFLPFIELLRKSLLALPEDLKQQSIGKGLQMVYDSFLVALGDMGIVPIEVKIGSVPDVIFHEPVSAQPTENPNLKGKIVMEIEQGFMYRKGDIQKVIKTSKVVVGQ